MARVTVAGEGAVTAAAATGLVVVVVAWLTAVATAQVVAAHLGRERVAVGGGQTEVSGAIAWSQPRDSCSRLPALLKLHGQVLHPPYWEASQRWLSTHHRR